MLRYFAVLFGAGAISMIVAVFAMVAPIGAEASVSGSDRQAVSDRSLAMCAAFYGPRRDLVEDRCNALPEVPRRSSGRTDEPVSDETLGDWPILPNITVSKTDVSKEVLE